jgi:hypothetical protein
LDDTAAIQAALDAYPNGNRIIYLRDGVYQISDTLSWPAGIPGQSDYKRTILEGRSRSGAVLRLADRTAAFGDPANARPVVYTGPSAPAQRFRNAVRNLTIHTGTGNPGAIGLHFASSNQGVVRDVTIRSGDGAGVVGLDLRGNENGPLLVRGLVVEGFAKGVSMNAGINGIVMENIRLSGQNLHGIDATGQVLTIRNLTSQNTVPAIWHGDPNARDRSGGFGGIARGGMLTLVGADLNGTGAASSVPAIIGQGFAFLRDVRTSGYRRAYERATPGGIQTVAGPNIAEFTTSPTRSLFPDTPAASLSLPVKETPEPPRDPLSAWVNIESFGARGDGSDDGPAIQAAIDSGATTLYFPAGRSFQIATDVILRGAVHRVIGTEGRWSATNGANLIFRAGSAPVVAVERFNGLPFLIHDSARTLVLSNSIASGGLSTGGGDFFVEDVSMLGWRFLNPSQNAWLRQFNFEGDAPVNVLNAGAKVWMLGIKTERSGIKVDTRDGGFTEILGAHIFDTGQPAPTTPIFRVAHASMTLAGLATSTFDGTNYEIAVEETRGDTTHTLSVGALASRTSANGKVLPLCNALRAPGTPVPTTPKQAWREKHGLPLDGSGIGADTHIPPGATLPNLYFYAFDTTPGPVAVAVFQDLLFNPASGFSARLERPANRLDVDLTIQTSTNLVSWQTVATSEGVRPFTPVGSVTLQETLTPDETRRLLFAQNIDATAPRRRFLRLRITTPPPR